MKKLLTLLLFSATLSAQSAAPMPLPPVPPVGQIIVHDVKEPQAAGFVQYRSVLSPMWVALTPGMKLGEGVLIRISDPRAQVTLGFPDGGFLRIIGTSSLYLDSISRITGYTNPDISISNGAQTPGMQSSYQTRVLLLSGRWFYSANPTTPTTFVVNSDITTSVIQNGSGGGYFIGGQGQMLLRSGQGRFGWRLTNNISGGTNVTRSRPIILEPGQIITMDIYRGFPTEMGVISESNYAEYGLFPPEARLTYRPQSYFSQDKALTSDQINFEGLDSLQNLQFVRKEDALAVGIARTITNVVVEAPPAAALIPKAIPLALLKPINLADFEIAAPPPANTVAPRAVEPPQAPAAPAAPRVRKRVQMEVPAAPVQKEAENLRKVTREKIDLAAATADIKATPVDAAPSPRRRPAALAPRIVAAPGAVQPAPSPAPPKKAENSGPAYKTPDFFDREHFTNDPAFQYQKFQAETVEDLMQGDFSRSLFY